MIRKPWTAALVLALLLSPSCRPGKVLLTPVPERVESLEGYASLSVGREGESIRSKFSFLLIPVDRGQIEVSNFLAGTVGRMIFTGETAYFVVPSRRVFWAGAEEEAIDRFLGFPLTLAEVVHMISGRWPVSTGGWVLHTGRGGRVVSGSREELAFRVEDFVPGTRLPRKIEFSHPTSRGRLTILRIGFNATPPDAAFSLEFRNRFQKKTWDEILELIHAPN